MEQIEIWGVVDEVKQTAANVEIVSPPPGSLGPLYQRWCYDRAKACKLEAGTEDSCNS